jgi:hypothetical protein
VLEHVRTHEEYLCFMLPRIKKLVTTQATSAIIRLYIRPLNKPLK